MKTFNLILFSIIISCFAGNISCVTKSVPVKKLSAQEQFAKGQFYESRNNRHEAFNWIKKAADKGYAEAQFDLGNRYYKAKSYTEAAKWYEKAAEQGHVKAQFNLGVHYQKGEGVPKSYTDAAKWYEKAAEQGYAKAQFILGLYYEMGREVTQNYTEAVKWYKKAADQGYDEAQSYLGVIYEMGRGVTQNYTEAAKWYKKAADQGNVEAQKNLEELYAKGQGISQSDTDAQYNLGMRYLKGDGVSKSYTEALRWLRKAADQGHIYSQYFIGGIYQNQFISGGIFETKPLLKKYGEEAVRWYQKAAIQGHEPSQNSMIHLIRDWDIKLKPVEDAQAIKISDLIKKAEQGDIEAQYQLGYNYAKGISVPQNVQEAGKWFYKAAIKGHPEAQHNIGLLFYKGYGVKQDSYKAIEWFSKAAMQEYPESTFLIGVIYTKGEGVPVDIAKGFKFLHESALQGHPEGQNHIGYCYGTGECQSLPKNLTKAIEWFKKAVNQGNREAMENLAAAEFEQIRPEYEKTMAKIRQTTSKNKQNTSNLSFSDIKSNDIWIAAGVVAGGVWLASEINKALEDNKSHYDDSSEASQPLSSSDANSENEILRSLISCAGQSIASNSINNPIVAGAIAEAIRASIEEDPYSFSKATAVTAKSYIASKLRSEGHEEEADLVEEGDFIWCAIQAYL